MQQCIDSCKGPLVNDGFSPVFPGTGDAAAQADHDAVKKEPAFSCGQIRPESLEIHGRKTAAARACAAHKFSFPH